MTTNEAGTAIKLLIHLQIGLIGICSSIIMTQAFLSILRYREKRRWLVGLRQRSSEIKGIAAFASKWLLGNRVWIWHQTRWQKCGYSNDVSNKRCMVWLICQWILGVSILFNSNGGLIKTIFAILILEGVFWGITSYRIKERQSRFATGVYKIYRYLGLHISAGISVTEILVHLHESVSQPYLKEALQRYASCYLKTMDVNQATEELLRRVEGDEIKVLAAVLRQGLETGDYYELIQKQESLMLKRYYTAMEEETNRIHTKGVCIAIGLCVLVFIMLAVPMLYEMGRATQQIFR